MMISVDMKLLSYIPFLRDKNLSYKYSFLLMTLMNLVDKQLVNIFLMWNSIDKKYRKHIQSVNL